MARKVDVEAVAALYKEGWSASRIAAFKGVSRQYVSRLVRGLKVNSPELVKRGVAVKNVHAQRVRAFVHHAGEAYSKSPNQQFKGFLDGVDVSCAGKVIYLRASKKFGGESESKALWNSLGFWEGVIKRLESRLGVIILKKGARAFEFLYSEYETRDSVVAVDAEARGMVWRVFHTQDGKLRLSVDRSDGLHNHETHHFRDSNVDSVVFERHVNSVLDAGVSAPSYTELLGILKDLAVHNRDTSAGLNAVAEVLKSQFPKTDEVVLEPLKKGGVWYVG